MDGLTYTIPLTERKEEVKQSQLLLVGFEEPEEVEERAVEKKNNNGKGKQILENFLA